MKYAFLLKPLQVGTTWGGRPCEALPLDLVGAAQ